MKNSLENGLDQMWFDVQRMTKKERKLTIKYIVNLNYYNSSFIDYQAKFFLAQLIQDSECFFNKTGTTTKVKEFDALNWYDSNNRLDYNKVMNL